MKYKIQKVKGAYRRYVSAKGPNLPFRTQVRVRHALVFKSLFMRFAQKRQASHAIFTILKQEEWKFDLIDKTQKFMDRIRFMQRRFREYKVVWDTKEEILRTLFTTHKQQATVKAINTKDRKAQRWLTKISDARRDVVIRRWILFCKEQHTILFSAWSAKLKTLKNWQMRKLRRLIVDPKIALRDPFTKVLNLDATNLGNRIDFMLPCLDPDIPAAQRGDGQY